MPEAPSQAFGEGVQSGNQQSYLSQILQNTKASQVNEAQLQAQRDQQIVPSASLHPSAAAFGTDLGNGTHAFKNPKLLNDALAQGELARGRETSVATQKALSNGIMAGAVAANKPITQDHPVYPILQAAQGEKPITAEMMKTLADYGKVHAQQGLGVQGVDEYGNSVGKANMPFGTSGEGSGGGPTLNSPEGQDRLGKGWKPEQKTVKDAYGRETQTTSWNPPANTSSVDRLSALRSLKAQGKVREDANLTNLSDAEDSLVTDRMTEKQATAAGQKAQNITVNQLGAKASGPVGDGVNAFWFPPSDKYPQGMNASSIPGMRVLSADDLMRAGAQNTAEWGKPKDVIESRNRDVAAFGHLAQLRDFMADPRNADLFPSVGSGGLTPVAQAKMKQAWAQIADKTDPRYGLLDTLDKTSLNLLAGIAPSTGNRLGYQIMTHMAGALPSSFKQPWTRESANASIQAMAGALSASAKSRMPAAMVDATMKAHGFNSDSVLSGLPQAGQGGMPAAPNTAGASGSVAGWGYKGVK